MGYLRAGKILRVNLTNRKITTEPIDQYTDRFFGGKGINAKILFDSIKKNTTAYDEENPLLFGVGPLVGTGFISGCEVDVMSVSPVSDSVGDSGMGGYFPAQLKFAGYDHLIIEGKSEKPVYLSIRDDKVEIKDASQIWGHDIYETADMVRQDLHDFNAEVIAIGPPGETGVIYASIQSPTGNSIARLGMGAVMGNKKLKAIAVHGSKGISVAKPKEFLALNLDFRERFSKMGDYEDRHRWGNGLAHNNELRKTFDIMGQAWPGSEAISERGFDLENLNRLTGCYSCPMPCYRGYDIPGVGIGAMHCSPPADLTWDVKNPSMLEAWRTFSRCQRYGLDSRSLSNAIAWLMEMYEKGIITKADTDGIEMKWGSSEAMVAICEKLINRQGIGDILADGLPAAAKKIGRGSEALLKLAKNSPVDAHMAPTKSGVLVASISPIGEDASIQMRERTLGYDWIHAKDEDEYQAIIKPVKDTVAAQMGVPEAADPTTGEGKPAMMRWVQIKAGVMDLTGNCRFVCQNEINFFIGQPSVRGPYAEKAIAEALSLGLGTPVTIDDLGLASERMLNMMRALQVKKGLTRTDDNVSKNFARDFKTDSKRQKLLLSGDAELEQMKDEYYRLMGWDLKKGWPTRATLAKLKLSDVADSLGI